MDRNKEDYWVEMSIREIWTQCHFALNAYNNIEKKTESTSPTDQAFSSIHSFLSHAANVSKMLKSIGDSGFTIGEVLGITGDSVIHKRKFRNHLEHYDDRLKQWIGRFADGANIGTYNIGPKSGFHIQNMIFVSHYDPTTKTFTFVDKDFRLDILAEEVDAIKSKADSWVNAMQNGKVTPHFIPST